MEVQKDSETEGQADGHGKQKTTRRQLRILSFVPAAARSGGTGRGGQQAAERVLRAFPLRFVIVINHLLRFNCCVNSRKSCKRQQKRKRTKEI